VVTSVWVLQGAKTRAKDTSRQRGADRGRGIKVSSSSKRAQKLWYRRTVMAAKGDDDDDDGVDSGEIRKRRGRGEEKEAVHDVNDGTPTGEGVSVERVEEGLGDGLEEVFRLL
jgi:hypothetical protein